VIPYSLDAGTAMALPRYRLYDKVRPDYCSMGVSQKVQFLSVGQTT